MLQFLMQFCDAVLENRVSPSTFVMHICLSMIPKLFWKMKVGKNLKQNIFGTKCWMERVFYSSRVTGGRYRDFPFSQAFQV
jgi:hypothetical protein